MQKTKIALAILLFASLACGLISPAAEPTEETNLEDAVAATLTAIALQTQPASIPPTDPIEAGGVAVTFSGISFTIPQGLATSATSTLVPASLDPQVPFWDIYPAHIQFTLDGYILQDKFFEPLIRVYPAAEFESANEGAAMIIDEMRSLLATQGSPLLANIPFLPLFNAAQIFHSNEQFITFQNGRGIRFLTQFGQNISPVNNHDLFYTFQGMTSDDKFYISAILPVNASFLSEFPSPEYPIPPDGVPFDWENWENTQTYMDAITQRLNNTDSAAFTPPLTLLDALIQSMIIASIP